MSIADQIANDIVNFDDLVTLTVSQNRAGTVTSGSVDNCQPTVLTRNELAALGGFLTRDVRAYSIPVSALTAAGLGGMAQGDFVTDPDSVAYKVSSAQLMSISTRWRVVVNAKQITA